MPSKSTKPHRKVNNSLTQAEKKPAAAAGSQPKKMTKNQLTKLKKTKGAVRGSVHSLAKK